MHKLDRNGRMPLYHQIAMRLEQMIALGEFPVDSRLPNERDLASMYGASRTTIRQALSVLEKSGVLERRRPDGTFVRGKPEKMSPSLSIPVSFVSSLVESGHDVDVQLLSVTSQFPRDATIATSLRIPNDQPVAKFVRLIQSESLPIAFVEVFIPLSLFPDVTERSLPNNSVHEMFLNSYGTVISDADHAIECVFATPTTANWLKIDVTSPVLRMESCYYDQHGRAVEFVYTNWRADRMKLRMKAYPQTEYHAQPVDQRRAVTD